MTTYNFVKWHRKRNVHIMEESIGVLVLYNRRERVTLLYNFVTHDTPLGIHIILLINAMNVRQII